MILRPMTSTGTSKYSGQSLLLRSTVDDLDARVGRDCAAACQASSGTGYESQRQRPTPAKGMR